MRVTTVVSSVREGRIAPTIAKWVNDYFATLEDISHSEIDLVEHELSRDLVLTGTSADVVAKTLEDSDAFVIITPEYNHGYPAELKLLLDSFSSPWSAKPFGFVGYGGQAGGIRAVEQLKPVVSELHGVPVRDVVHLASPWESFGPRGFVASERENRALKTMLTTIQWWAEALETARRSTPYPSGH